MPTDYGDLPTDILAAFETSFPFSDDPGVAAEMEALEKLFGHPMPPEIGRVLELERHDALSPRPAEVAAAEHPFEALILRAQELDDCVSVLFALTGSVYLRRYEGWADLVGHVVGIPGRPVAPFVAWRRDKWAADLPSFARLAQAQRKFEAGEEDDVEPLLEPIWGRVGPTEYTEELFYWLEDTGAKARLDSAWGDRTDLRATLAQWWRHERALFLGFAMLGKFRTPEPGAFDLDPAKALDDPDLLRNLGLQMATLWRAWFLEDDAVLDRVLAALEASPSAYVQDSRRLVTELRDGRREIGRVDFVAAREQYGTWLRDPDAHGRHERTVRRAELEAALEPSRYGIELVRADWPLDGEVATTPGPIGRQLAWDPESRTLTLDGQPRVLPEPPNEQRLYLARNQPLFDLSPSGRVLVVDATQHRPQAGGNVQVLALHDLESGTWRTLGDSTGATWYAAFDDDRWLWRDRQSVYLLRDIGQPQVEATASVGTSQPHSFWIPELGVLVAYGSADLANGRPLDDRGAPFVRVLGFFREGLAEVAAFGVDGVELVAEQHEGRWRVGLISADRAVAWELRGLAEGVAAWQKQAREALAAEQAKRDALGEVTVDRVIEAVNVLFGATYTEEIQAGVSEVFAEFLERMAERAEVVAAARDAESFEPLLAHVRGFGQALVEAAKGERLRPVMGLAVQVTVLNPAISDVVGRAAALSAWKALRGR